jgi:membrane-associated phosphatidylinositol transfer protein
MKIIGNLIFYLEYRIPMPFTTEEYSKGLYYAESFLLRENCEEVPTEIKSSKDYDEYEKLPKGYFTHRVYHVGVKVPNVFKLLFPDEAFQLHEECYNSLENGLIMKTITTVYIYLI